MVAKQEGKNSTTLLVQLTCIFWLVAKLISWKLWTADRVFPIVPVLPFLRNVSPFLHLALYSASIVCLLTSLFRPWKAILGALLVLEVMSCLLDYNRVQPWEYQYGLIMLALLINRDDDRALAAIAFIVAMLYVYSGLSKFNPGFLSQVWDRMVLKDAFHMSDNFRHNYYVYRLGYSLALLEMLAGICLFFKPIRKVGAIFLITMHLLNLIWLGPFGRNYNIIIWPWNIAMCFFLFTLFITSNSSKTYSMSFKGGNICLIVLCGALPALNFIGLWDHYLSGSLYSGKTPKMTVNIQDISSIASLRPFLQGKPNDSDLVLNVSRWALQELKVPPYPELRVYEEINRQLHKAYPNTPFISVVTSYRGSIQLK